MSKKIQRMPIGVPLLLAALGALAMAGCDRHAGVHAANAASPSAVLIGTPPAPPSAESVPPNGTVVLRETPEVTPVTKAETELTKKEESRDMPLAGQPNDHSNLAPDASQHAGQSDAQQQPERTGESNSPQRDSQATGERSGTPPT